MLIVVATPIGNLEDISKRALDALASCDAILCEDTRHSRILLDRYGIQKPLVAYHKFKEKALLEKILEELEGGKNLALVSDAGTPCINDPGRLLVEACHERGLAVTAIPGPCSVIQGLVLSGFETEAFQFIGFLPKKGEGALRRAMGYPGTTVALESPERLVGTLEAIEAIDGERKIAVVREMTKTFEECKRGVAKELLAHYRAHAPRGEIVLVWEGGKIGDDLSVEETVQMLQEGFGMSLKEAIPAAAKLKNLPKREVYRKFHH
jgi:16S rRNA (cytidine1402-2'-O)-methyltransferase